MTYKEALAYIDRIKDTVIDMPVKGIIIESLFIAPTKWEDMCDFMNARIQKGDEVAAIEYAAKGNSLSVYGFSETQVDDKGNVPKWNLTNLDNWELVMNN